MHLQATIKRSTPRFMRRHIVLEACTIYSPSLNTSTNKKNAASSCFPLHFVLNALTLVRAIHNAMSMKNEVWRPVVDGMTVFFSPTRLMALTLSWRVER